ncbi:RND family efflux transporter, MFP subunit [Daejeonella rubra]|uniref:RND family efflux transporter, MFP subunit n=2 Tax=Daejeonella rubra TaxID=990371 RepID=A0A1G9NR07_9SPHI|nr:RND family efflux transporter, MFP subunit [Daejeonella rubra]
MLLTGVMSCNRTSTEEDHAHAADGSHPGEELQALSYTLYTDKSELFVEFKPLVVGQVSKFAAHLTHLGENFTPYTEGTVTVSLVTGNKGIKHSADAPSSPGIYRLALQPTHVGTGKLIFDIKTKDFSDQIVIDSIPIYADEKTAIATQPKEEVGTDISYLKEQAWKVEFSNMPVVRQTIYDVIKTTGQVQAAPGDEAVVVAKSAGIVKFRGANILAGLPVRSGQALFSVSGGDIAVDNIDAAIRTARAEQNSAKAEFERFSELIKDKLITQTEFQQAKLRYQQSQIALTNLSKSYGAGGKSAVAPSSGFIKDLLVTEGQYVAAGQPLATITKNSRLVLRADVSLKDVDRMSLIKQANFTIIQNKQTYSTQELNGRLLSVAKTTGNNTPYIPVHFEIDSKSGIMPGSYAQVYLQTTPIYNAFVIPETSLIEEQGVFYVYVQTAGESFQKREVKTGANDGKNIQILSGIAEGERVVDKGSYQIKLATMSGTMPAHGHEH